MSLSFNRRRLLAAAGAGGLATALGATLAPHALAQGAAAAAKPETWVALPAVRFPILSSDGSRDATLATVNGSQSIIVFTVATGKANRIDIGTADVGEMFWVGNSHIAVVTEIPSRRMNMGLGSTRLAAVYNVDSNSRISLFDAIANFQSGVVGDIYPIVREGKAMVAATSYWGPDKGFAYLYALDPDTGHGEMLDRAPEETDGWIIQPDGTPVVRSAYYFHNQGWTAEHYDGQSWKQMYHSTVEMHAPQVLGLGRDGKSVVVLMPNDGDVGMYYEMAADGTLSAPLVDDATSRQPIFHPTQFNLVGFSHDTGWPQYEFSDPALADLARKAQGAMQDYRMRLDAWSDDAAKAIVYSEGDDDSGTWYYINFATGVSMEVGLAYPDISPDAVGAVSVFAYKASDGTPIEAILTLPAGKPATGLPLVVMPHGRNVKPFDPQRSDPPSRDDQAVNWIAQALAAAGYAVLQPNYRGSGGYGDAFIAAGYGQWGAGKRLTDVSDGVAALAAQGTIDAKRVAIMGEGTGGYMALCGVTLQQGLYRCAVDIAGLADVTAMMNLIASGPEGLTSPRYKHYARLFGTTDFDAISPIGAAARADAPVLILHSQDEPGVQYQQSSRMAGALHGAGKDVTLVTTKSTDDWKANQAWRDEVMTPVLAFLAKNNPA